MLVKNGIEANLQVVIDGNDIDRYVHKFKPSVVILEAIWCPPYKLVELQKLYPKIKWVVRLHSEISFLSNEGMAFLWLQEYVKIPNVTVAANSLNAVQDLDFALGVTIDYLPNYYPIECEPPAKKKRHKLNVGCFGAVRPMKNQLIQAIAALEYAAKNRVHLYFHINSTRAEQGGSSVLKNLRALFKDRKNAELIEHPWMDHVDFRKLIGQMDINLAVSFSETFCIVVSDAVAEGVPVVVSDQVHWVIPLLHAKTTDSIDIIRKMTRALGIFKSYYTQQNLMRLKKFSNHSQKIWLKYLTDKCTI